MAYQLPSAIPYNPTITPWEVTANNEYPGEVSVTEVLESYPSTLGSTPLLELFPVENIYETKVIFEQTFEGVATIWPLVQRGQPDVFTTSENGITRRFEVSPAYIRKSINFSYANIQNRVRPGTMNDLQPAQEYIDNQLRIAREEHDLTWDVWRAKMLQGGISYTDPRTGQPINVAANIPAWNYFSFDNTSGYGGRNEANLFRGLIDSNVVGNAPGVPWTNPDFDFPNFVRRLKIWHKTTNKTELTGMYMHPWLRTILSLNNGIKQERGGVVYSYGAERGQQFLNQQNRGGGFDFYGPKSILASPSFEFSDGELSGILGVKIYTVDTEFKDPEDGVRKYVWPLNKVVFVSQVGFNGSPQPIGRTQYCVTEGTLQGTPGMWSRTYSDVPPPAAPGMSVQMGNSGLPYIKYPYKVLSMRVCEVQDVKNLLGIVGDLNFGTY